MQTVMIKRNIVLGHGYIVKVIWPLGRSNPLKSGCMRPYFTGAVRAKIEEDDGIKGGNCGDRQTVTPDDRWQDKLVRHTRLIGRSHRLNRIIGRNADPIPWR